MDERPVLIGLGAWDRGDDAVGLVVADALRPRLRHGVCVITGRADAMALVLALEGRRVAVAVDALRLDGVEPGTRREVDLTIDAPPGAPPRASGHGDALGQGWRLARALGAMPPRAVLVGVVGRTFALGAPLSAEVRRALPALEQAVVAALDVSAI